MANRAAVLERNERSMDKWVDGGMDGGTNYSKSVYVGTCPCQNES